MFPCWRSSSVPYDEPGSRDPTPPSRWTLWHDLPHRLFFAHSSPTWGGGGVAFVDVDAKKNIKKNDIDDDEHGLGTTFRLYRVTLEQFNDVLAQENGMKPGDPACAEITPEEARTLALEWEREWERQSSPERLSSLSPERLSSSSWPERERERFRAVHGGVVAGPGPPAEMRAPSERWYGYVRCVGSLEGEAVLTFTCPPEELRRFRNGNLATNPPSEAYLGTIERGLVQVGVEVDAAREYLRRRCDAPMIDVTLADDHDHDDAVAAGREDDTRAGVA